ncbi:MAG: GNAT family N-acetyltransferase [Alphaproteobacteria bacterium]|nr:GNAT family N-acetyltransferase [Alphaproteobacteria bacterium]MCL2504978.1 GNAT family N-acetyltransferase [Alphaproteobacteria bacterium]
MDITIRKARHKDLEHLGSTIFLANYTVDNTLIAEVDGKMAGWVSYSCDRLNNLSKIHYFKPARHGLYVHNIQVKEEFRLQGVGTELYEELFRRYDGLPIGALVLPSNTASVYFHMKHGFKLIGRGALFFVMQHGGVGEPVKRNQAEYQDMMARIEENKPKSEPSRDNISMSSNIRGATYG